MEKTYSLSGTATSTLDVSEQFIDLVNALLGRDFFLTNSASSEFFIAINHDPGHYADFVKKGGNPNKTVLILLEPFAVYPSQYSSRILNSYALVLAPGNPNFRGSNGKFIPWPYESVSNPLRPSGEDCSLISQLEHHVRNGVFLYENWSRREHFITMINANKVSPVKNENYGLRRKYARSIPPQFLSVYGDLWNSSLLKKALHRLSVLYFSIKSSHFPAISSIYGNLHWSYASAKGFAGDKQAILRSSKFSLVIENDSSYVSEKLLDVLVNGCIPIYFGLKCIQEFIPEDVFIQLPDHPSHLLPVLNSLSDQEVKEFLLNIEKFVTSSSFTNSWEKRIVFKEIAAAIDNHFRFDYV